MTGPALHLPQHRGATRLRALRRSDLPRFAAYRADPALAEYQSWEPMSRDAAERFLHETADATHLQAGEWTQLAIADSGSDGLVGDLGLYLSEDCTYSEVGFTLARDGQGKGHATRATELAVELVFRIASVAEVRAVTERVNQASIAVLRRAGFLQTGSRATVFKGRSCTEDLFVRVRPTDAAGHRGTGST